VRLCSVASGSSGNCIYVGTDTTHLLVDAGISGKRIFQGLDTLDLCGKDLDGILITHEHSDHISGLGVLARKLNIPIFATEGTIQELKKINTLGSIDESLYQPVHYEQKFYIKDILVDPIKISHDSVAPVAYRFVHGQQKVGIMTDLGHFDDYIAEKLMGLDALLLEANHDVNMLQVGPYPYYLKQRILGDRGHLSNENAGRLLNKILHSNLKHIILGHLSRENNMPDLAYETVRMEITMADHPYKGDDFNITVALRSEPSPVIEF
jgi:phosphoribosyl 1,2-cyclic phosphodiesterase